MKKTIIKITALSLGLLSLTISANAQWTRNSVSGYIYPTVISDKIGIGTNTPSYQLDIKQPGVCSFRIQSQTSGSSNLILSRSAAPGQNCLVNYKTGTTDLWFTGVAGNNDDFRIRNAATTDMFYIGQTSGRMGFATASPLLPFDFKNGGSNNSTTDACMSIGTSNGYHLSLDNNEIQSRSNNTGGNNTLFLNFWGGDISMNYFGGNSYTGGSFGVGGAVPSYSKLDVAGMVGNTSASFGINQRGISLVTDYPGVYYNSYFNGNGISMASGYSGILNFDPDGGRWAVALTTTSAASGGLTVSNVDRLSIESVSGTATFTPTSGYNGIVVNDPGNGGILYCLKTGANNGMSLYKTSTSTATPTLYCSSNAASSNAIEAYCVANAYAGYFGGNVYCTGSYLPSDQNLKQNIKTFNGGLDIIKNLTVKTYDYKTDGLVGKMNLPEGNQVGIMAQDLEREMPQLVKANKFWEGSFTPGMKEGEGQTIDFKAVNYVGLVPVLVQSVNELNTINQKLADRVDALESQLAQCCSNASRQGALENGTLIEKSAMQQNQPNPFNKSTVISYTLKSGDSNAKIVIRDLNGNMVRELSIAQSGKGQVTINANTLAQGTYTYTLQINNESVDTKLMVVTK